MKTRVLILISIFLFLATFLLAGGEKDKISKRVFWRTMSGTWINSDYTGEWPFYEQKLIVYPDGKLEYYPMVTDTKPTRELNNLTIEEAWIDSEGIIWYKAIRHEPGGDFYELGKISESGNIWEYIADSHNEPTEWDTSITKYEWYEIRNRQL